MYIIEYMVYKLWHRDMAYNIWYVNIKILQKPWLCNPLILGLGTRTGAAYVYVVFWAHESKLTIVSVAEPCAECRSLRPGAIT